MIEWDAVDMDRVFAALEAGIDTAELNEHEDTAARFILEDLRCQWDETESDDYRASLWDTDLPVTIHYRRTVDIELPDVIDPRNLPPAAAGGLP